MYEQQFNPYSPNIEIVKGYLKSGKVLVLGILYLLSIAVSVITVLTLPSAFMSFDYSSLLSSMGIDPSQAVYAVDTGMNSSTVSMLISTAISSVFTLLSAIAFIIIFAKSRSDNPDSNPSAGVGILRVISLISFICAVISVVCFVLIFAAAYFFLDYIVAEFNLNADAATVIWIICGVVILIFSFFLLFYTASCKNFYRSIKRSLNSVDLHTKGSVAYGVFNIIGAVFVGIALIGSVISVIAAFSLTSLMSFAAVLLAFLSSVFTASFALGYNRHIKREKYSYSNTPYGDTSGRAYVPADNGANPYTAPRSHGYDDNYQSYHVPPQSAQGYRSDYTGHSDIATYCPNCGAPADVNEPYCPNCGSKL